MTTITKLQKQVRPIFNWQYGDSIPDRIAAIETQKLTQYDKDSIARMFLRVVDLAAHVNLTEHDLLHLAEQRAKVDQMRMEAAKQ